MLMLWKFQWEIVTLNISGYILSDKVSRKMGNNLIR